MNQKYEVVISIIEGTGRVGYGEIIEGPEGAFARGKFVRSWNFNKFNIGDRVEATIVITPNELRVENLRLAQGIK